MMVTWNELAIIGVISSYLLTVLIYMLSYLLNSEVLRAWSKLEMQNVFITLVLFASLASFASFSYITDYVTSSQEYISYLFNKMVSCQASFIADSNVLSLIASITFNFNPSVFSMRGTPQDVKSASDTDTANMKSSGKDKEEGKAPGLSTWHAGISFAPFLQPLLTSVANVQSYMFIPLGMVKLHHLIISFVVDKGASALLPLGIFFRSFKFSRHAGNLLIALFMALYLVLPGMYLFNKELLVQTMGMSYNPSDPKCGESDILTDLGGVIMTKFAGKTDAYKGLASEFGVGSGFDNPTISDLVGNAADNLSYGSSSGIAVIFLTMGVEGMLLPMLAIIVSLGMAREFAHLLGSEIDFSQLVRVV